jgi:protein phosphatase 1L
MVKPIEDPEQAAKRLLQEASVRGSADNITVVIVRFLDGTTTTGAGPSEEVAKDQSS